MTLIIIVLAALLGVVLLVLGYIIKKQRQFVNMDELCKNAMSQISVQLNSRWDAVQALALTAAKYAQHETLINVIRERRQDHVNTPQQLNEQQGALTQVFSRLMAIGESYPELKADTLYHEAMAGMRDYEEKVRLSRMVYNDTATKMNRMVRMWPSSMVAGMLNFNEREYLTVDESRKTSYPDLDELFKK